MYDGPDLNSLLALGDPDKNELYADFSQWEASVKNATLQQKAKEKKQESAPVKGKLSYSEKKEYEQIEGKIAQQEEEVRELNLKLENPAIAQDTERLQTLCTEIGLAETRIEQLYIRWEKLDKKQKG